MKKLIFFLCRMPGIFLVTLPILGTSLFVHRHELDERWWISILMALMITLVANIYLFFIHGEKIGETTKGSKWVGIILIGTLTVLGFSALISLKSQTVIEFPSDHAIQSVTVESMCSILLWAWFALFWNMNVSSYSPVYEEIEQPKIKRTDRLLDPKKNFNKN